MPSAAGPAAPAPAAGRPADPGEGANRYNPGMSAPPAEPAAEDAPPAPPGGAAPPDPPPGRDGRLYARAMRDWRAVIKTDFAKQYCHLKMPGEDYYHLLTGGELYLDNGESKLCLNCAARSGVLTADRFHWRREEAPVAIRVLPDGEV